MLSQNFLQNTPLSRLRRVLWCDFTAGAVVGTLLLVLSGWLEAIYSMPRLLLVAMGAAGILYASLALSLAVRPAPPQSLVALLGSANLVWAAICLLMALALSHSASWLGLAHLAVEAMFVFWLGFNELRLRRD